jgi:AcrR family transcriptional regulator
MDARELLLEAALKVFAEHGTRGATTRRIAHAAGVNEVTLFRHFGSKDGLLREALATSPRALAFVDTHLPETPVDPHGELTEFCRHHHRTLFESRSIIRKCMGEFEENPETTRSACQLPVMISDALRGYLERLRDAGLERFPYSEREGIKHYVALFLQAIGAVAPARRALAPVSPARRPARPARGKTTASRR